MRAATLRTVDAKPGQITITLHAVGPDGYVQFHQPGRLHRTPKAAGDVITIPAAGLVHDGGDFAYGKLIVVAARRVWPGPSMLRTISDEVQVYVRITGEPTDVLNINIGQDDWATSATLTGAVEEPGSTA